MTSWPPAEAEGRLEPLVVGLRQAEPVRLRRGGGLALIVRLPSSSSRRPGRSALRRRPSSRRAEAVVLEDRDEIRPRPGNSSRRIVRSCASRLLLHDVDPVVSIDPVAKLRPTGSARRRQTSELNAELALEAGRAPRGWRTARCRNARSPAEARTGRRSRVSGTRKARAVFELRHAATGLIVHRSRAGSLALVTQKMRPSNPSVGQQAAG